MNLAEQESIPNPDGKIKRIFKANAHFIAQVPDGVQYFEQISDLKTLRAHVQLRGDIVRVAQLGDDKIRVEMADGRVQQLEGSYQTVRVVDE